MTLKGIRKQFNISQLTAANDVNVPLRTYSRYENDESYGSSLKRNAMIASLKGKYEITESKGVLTVEQIVKIVNDIFDSDEYKGKIEFCYLFGSYAKGRFSEKSDVDLCISSDITGFDYFGLVEKLRVNLHKNVDLVRLADLKINFDLIAEILKDGLKIYG